MCIPVPGPALNLWAEIPFVTNLQSSCTYSACCHQRGSQEAKFCEKTALPTVPSRNEAKMLPVLAVNGLGRETKPSHGDVPICRAQRTGGGDPSPRTSPHQPYAPTGEARNRRRPHPAQAADSEAAPTAGGSAARRKSRDHHKLG